MNSQIKTLNKLNTSEINRIFQTKELSELHDFKNYCDDIYFNTHDFEIIILKDNIYDVLLEVIQQKEQPTYIAPIGSKITSDKEVKLPYFLGSMNKMKN